MKNPRFPRLEQAVRDIVGTLKTGTVTNNHYIFSEVSKSVPEAYQAALIESSMTKTHQFMRDVVGELERKGVIVKIRECDSRDLSGNANRCLEWSKA